MCWHGVEPTYKTLRCTCGSVPWRAVMVYPLCFCLTKQKMQQRRSCKLYSGLYHCRLEILLYIWVSYVNGLRSSLTLGQFAVKWKSRITQLLLYLAFLSPYLASHTWATCRVDIVSHKQSTLNAQLLSQRKIHLKLLRHVSLLTMIITIL